MSEFLLAPRSELTPARENLRDMLDANELVAYRVRANGTARLIKLLPVASLDREVAEWIYDQVEDGRSIRAVARDIHASTATVRRFLLALELTEEVEAGEWDAHWADANGFAYEEPADELTTAGFTDTFLGELADDLTASATPSTDEKAASVDAGVVFS